MRISKKIAEKVGFEPTLRFWRKHLKKKLKNLKIDMEYQKLEHEKFL